MTDSTDVQARWAKQLYVEPELTRKAEPAAVATAVATGRHRVVRRKRRRIFGR